MALYIAQEVVHNAFTDLNDCPGRGASSFNSLPKSTSEVLQQSGHRKRKHASGSATEQLNGTNVGAEALDWKPPAPLSVKIAALKALEALLTVVCINIISKACLSIHTFIVDAPKAI